MNKLYAFASDYDNTLFMHTWYHPGVALRDRRAISSFQKSGALFGLCTGRPYRGFFLDPFIKKLQIDFYITSTGAHILSSSGDVLFEKTLDYDIVREIFSSEDKKIGHSIQMDGDFYLIGRNFTKRPTPVLSSLSDAKGHKIYETSFRLANEKKAAETTARINERFGDAVAAFQNVRDIDIVAKGCSKGTGLLFIKEHFGIDSIGAMGDSLNDIPLVKAADLGYTFKKSPSLLVSKADCTAKNVSHALNLFRKHFNI